MSRRLQTPTAFSPHRLIVILGVLIALTALPRSAPAQAVYGSIAGTVVDPSGGLLPGVSVTVTSVERKTTDTVVTNESGHYVKERLLPGTLRGEDRALRVQAVGLPGHPGERRHADDTRRQAGGRRKSPKP